MTIDINAFMSSYEIDTLRMTDKYSITVLRLLEKYYMQNSIDKKRDIMTDMLYLLRECKNCITWKIIFLAVYDIYNGSCWISIN